MTYRWFPGQPVLLRRGEFGDVWWGDSVVIESIADDGYLLCRWDNGERVRVLPDDDVIPLKVALRRNARVLRQQAAMYERVARGLPSYQDFLVSRNTSPDSEVESVSEKKESAH